MTWAIEFEEPYDAWDVTTDVEDGTEIRLAVLEFMRSWRDIGPPEDAEYDPLRDTCSCPVPGTPILVEFVASPSSDPPAVVVRRFT